MGDSGGWDLSKRGEGEAASPPPGGPTPPPPPAGWGPPGQDQPYAQQPPTGQPYGQPPAGQFPPPGYPPGGFPPPGYPPSYGPPGAGAKPSGKATTVLVLGIASLVLLFTCGIGIIPAIVALCLAPGARREIAQANGAPGGESMIRAGRICSWITVVLSVLAVVAAIALFAFSLQFDSWTSSF